MPGGQDGLTVQRALALRGEHIVFLTGHGDVPTCTQAMKAGAVDFLLKPVDPESFLAAVRLALGRSAAQIRHKNLASGVRQKVASLTPREAEVLACVVAGMLNKQIASHGGKITVGNRRGGGARFQFSRPVAR